MVDAKKTTSSSSTKPKIAVPDTPVSQMATQSIRNYLIIIIAVTTLVVLVGGYFIYTLAQANIKRALEVRAQDYQIKLSENKLAKLKEAEPKLEELKRADGDRPSRFDFITERTLPTNIAFDTVLTIFDRLQEDYNVDIESISKVASTATSSSSSSTPSTSPSSEASGGGSATTTQAKSHTISIKATGSREGVIGYLRALEASSRIFDFSSMKIDGKVGTPYTLDIQYKIYSFEKPSVSSTEINIDEYETKKGEFE
jgi:Tfp pilus assembly protein PilO